MYATAASPALRYTSSRPALVLIAAALAAGLAYASHELFLDLSSIRLGAQLPYVLLGIALLIALGFEFVNGFHDTANAVATVIYTNSLPPQAAVVWSGAWNFVGVLFSSGAVAFGIVALLPVELILQVGSGAGFAMVFALLFAAILWNLGTWYLGLPASSSHTLIGSIIGVGLANQLMQPGSATSGVEWGQVSKVGYSLLLSPLIGFLCAALTLVIMKVLSPDEESGAFPCTRRKSAAAIVDQRFARADLHWRELRPRLQRRTKRNGPDHAYSDRNSPDGLRP